MVISKLMTLTSRLIRSFSFCITFSLVHAFTIEACVFESGAVVRHGRAVLSRPPARRSDHSRTPVALLQTVADDAHAAMRAGGRERMDREFEAVEPVGLALRNHLKGLVIGITSRVAFRHVEFL